MRYRIDHQTTYRYSEAAALSLNELCLKPRQSESQRPVESAIRVAPHPDYLEERLDYFGNTVTSFMVQEPHRELTVAARAVVDVLPRPLPDPRSTPPWEQVREALRRHDGPELLDAYQFTFESPMVTFFDELEEYARRSFPEGKAVLAAALHLTARIFADFTYEKSATTVNTPMREAFLARKGVCQDFAHIQIGCLRALGLAARYVSGYLETLPPPGKEKMIGADASHAWLSLFIPGSGWIDLDPTNNLAPSHQHLTLSWGRDYTDVIPVKGVVLGGGEHDLAVTVDVTPLPE